MNCSGYWTLCYVLVVLVEFFPNWTNLMGTGNPNVRNKRKTKLVPCVNVCLNSLKRMLDRDIAKYFNNRP